MQLLLAMASVYMQAPVAPAADSAAAAVDVLCSCPQLRRVVVLSTDNLAYLTAHLCLSSPAMLLAQTNADQQ